MWFSLSDTEAQCAYSEEHESACATATSAVLVTLAHEMIRLAFVNFESLEPWIISLVKVICCAWPGLSSSAFCLCLQRSASSTPYETVGTVVCYRKFSKVSSLRPRRPSWDDVFMAMVLTSFWSFWWSLSLLQLCHRIGAVTSTEIGHGRWNTFVTAYVFRVIHIHTIYRSLRVDNPSLFVEARKNFVHPKNSLPV